MSEKVPPEQANFALSHDENPSVPKIIGSSAQNMLLMRPMNTRVMMTLAFAAISAVGIAAEIKTPAKTSTANSTNLLEITGMTCNACAKGLTSELNRTPGVVSASVSFSNKLATVAIDTNQLSQKTLLSAIKEAGFGAKPKP